MAYHSIQTDLSKWPHVEAFITGPLESLYFRDVHDLLRLPLKDAGIAAGCNFAIGHVLLAAISGLSTTLYRPTTNSYGRAFESLLIEVYPWEQESSPPANKDEKRKLAHALYEEFRGPLTHHLGLWTYVKKGQRRVRDRGYAVKFKRLSQPDGNGLPEQTIELIESAASWPLNVMTQTLQIRKDAKILKLERFYWGVRQMVIRLSKNAVLMGQAEKFLSDVRPATA